MIVAQNTVSVSVRPCPVCKAITQPIGPISAGSAKEAPRGHIQRSDEVTNVRITGGEERTAKRLARERAAKMGKAEMSLFVSQPERRRCNSVTVVVVADGKTVEGKKLINSNIAIELGYALRGAHGPKVIWCSTSSCWSLGADDPCVTATLANLALVRREQHQYVGRVALPPGTHDRRPGSRTGTSGGVLRS
jgi:hypothetical protein